MPGPLPIPTRLKALRGNPGKRPLNESEPQPTPGIPEMPAWLNTFPVAVSEWEREAKELNLMGILTLAETGVLAMRAYLASQIQAMAAEIQVEGRMIAMKVYSKKTKRTIVVGHKPNPKCAQLASLLPEYRSLGASLGLDPASRSRLHVSPKREVSKFGALIGMDGGKR